MERTKKHKVTTFLHAEVGVLENDIILEVGRVVRYMKPWFLSYIAKSYC